MAAPKAAPKPVTKPPVKPSPGAKAAALQQAAASKQFAAQQAATQKSGATGRTPVVNAQTGFKTGTKALPAPAAKSKPGTGYQPKSGFPRPPAGTMNPVQKALTPGSGGIAAAMKGGAERKKGIFR